MLLTCATLLIWLNNKWLLTFTNLPFLLANNINAFITFNCIYILTQKVLNCFSLNVFYDCISCYNSNIFLLYCPNQ